MAHCSRWYAICFSPRTLPHNKLITLLARSVSLHLSECHERHSVDYARKFDSCNFWGLTGTPMTSDRSELGAMLRALGHNVGANAQTFGLGIGTAAPIWPQNNQALQDQAFIEKMRKLMIRHTKSQQIHGQTALALPELDAATVWLDMTPLERRAYDVAKRFDYRAHELKSTHQPAKSFHIAMCTCSATCEILFVHVTVRNDLTHYACYLLHPLTLLQA